MPDIDQDKSELPVSFYFSVSLKGGVEPFAFMEVSGINVELLEEEVAEGGENRFKYKLPRAKVSDLVLKRGTVQNSSSFASWCNDALTQGLGTAVTTKTITVSLLSATGDKLLSWDFINAYPVKWSVADLGSQDGMLAVETVEFAYTYFERN